MIPAQKKESVFSFRKTVSSTWPANGRLISKAVGATSAPMASVPPNQTANARLCSQCPRMTRNRCMVASCHYSRVQRLAARRAGQGGGSEEARKYETDLNTKTRRDEADKKDD